MTRKRLLIFETNLPKVKEAAKSKAVLKECPLQRRYVISLNNNFHFCLKILLFLSFLFKFLSFCFHTRSILSPCEPLKAKFIVPKKALISAKENVLSKGLIFHFRNLFGMFLRWNTLNHLELMRYEAL